MTIYLPKKYKQRIGVKVTSDTSEIFLRKVSEILFRIFEAARQHRHAKLMCLNLKETQF